MTTPHFFNVRIKEGKNGKRRYVYYRDSRKVQRNIYADHVPPGKLDDLLSLANYQRTKSERMQFMSRTLGYLSGDYSDDAFGVAMRLKIKKMANDQREAFKKYQSNHDARRASHHQQRKNDQNPYTAICGALGNALIRVENQMRDAGKWNRITRDSVRHELNKTARKLAALAFQCG